jgi:hypothetical protein
MADSIEQLSFELSANALMEQERALAGLRACAGTVLAGASIAGSFLGASGAGRDAWAIPATVSFALCFATAIWVLLPHGLLLAFGGTELLAVCDELGVLGVDEAYSAVINWIDPSLRINARTIDRLEGWLTLSCALLAVEVISWTLSLAG